MARSDHGYDCSKLTQQSGSRFVKTRAGLDNGMRFWIVDTDSAARRQPLIGSPDRVYKGMFLEELEAEEMPLNLTKLTGRYLGLIDTRAMKPDVFDESTDAEYNSVVPQEAIQPVTFLTPIPRVTHTYLAKEKPSPLEVGQEKVPPGYPEKFTPGQAYTGITIDAPIIQFSGWVLVSRQTRRAGLTGKGSIYEVVDAYRYQYLTTAGES